MFKSFPVEFIYIDDGSTDGTYENLPKRYFYNNLFKFIKLKRNSGPGIARNYGLKKSQGKYVIFLDSDDMLIKNGIKRLLEVIQKKNYDIIYLNYKKKGFTQINLSRNNFTKEKILKKYLRTELDMGPNFYLFRKEFLVINKIFFKRGYYEDILFMLKVFTKMKIQGRCLFKAYIKNDNKFSITNTFSFRHVSDFNKACLLKKKYFFSNIRGSFKSINSSDLQFGLRGDYVFSNKILKKCSANRGKINFNRLFYRKIISNEFVPLTTYDKIVKKELFS